MRIRKFKENMLRENGIAFFPSTAIYYITYRCNLNCRYCFQRKQYLDDIDTYTELSTDCIKQSFNNLKFKNLFLTGGEIFLRQDIKELIEFFSDRTQKLSLFTNGTILGEKDIELIRILDNIDIWFSIDGLYDVNDCNRGKGTFQKILENLKKLDNKKIFINSVITENNIDYLDQLYRFANEIGIEEVTFQFPMWYEECDHFSEKYGFDCYCGMPGTLNLQFMMRLKKQIEALKKFSNYKTRYRFYPSIFCDNIHDYIDGTIRRKKSLICSDIIEPKLKILTNGDVVICEAFKTKIGNITINHLEDIWNGERAVKIRKTLLNNNLTEMCSRCCNLDYSSKGASCII